MSTLNFALQNVSLARSEITDEFESLVHTQCNQKVTCFGGSSCGLNGSCNDCNQSMFQAMKLKGQPVKVGVPATEAELFAYSAFIDPSLEYDKLMKVDLKNAIALQSFWEKQSHASHYVYQIKKFIDESCYYCAQHPDRLSPEVFQELSFLPLPL